MKGAFGFCRFSMVELFYRVSIYSVTVWVCKSSEKIKSQNTVDYLVVCIEERLWIHSEQLSFFLWCFSPSAIFLLELQQQPIIEPWDFVPIASRLWGRTIEKVVLKSDSLDSFLEKAKDNSKVSLPFLYCWTSLVPECHSTDADWTLECYNVDDAWVLGALLA